MCKSAAEGGQRCYSHAMKAYQRASTAYREPGSPRWTEAVVHARLVDLASTPKGAKWVAEVRDKQVRYPIQRAYYESVLRQGALINERNKALGELTRQEKARERALRSAVPVVSETAARLVGVTPEESPRQQQVRDALREEADQQVIAEARAASPGSLVVDKVDRHLAQDRIDARWPAL